ncbi:ATP-dependent DNA helicase [Trichonephila clavipes]|nr:ATP-dependent DNA helicase [Trichonephila clavipes]
MTESQYQVQPSQYGGCDLRLVTEWVRIPKTTPKTPAERSRDYRARKRQKSEENQESNDLTRITVEVEVHQEQDNSQPSTSTLPIKKEKKNFNRTCSRIQDNDLRVPYPTFHRHQNAHKEFKEKFINNSFGHVCSVCERLWFKEDLKYASIQHQEILNIILPHVSNDKIALCNTCVNALNKNNIPIMAVYNGFKYPQFPSHLPPLDILSERLISPRIPFMQIRRLRHVNGQYGILGQIINVPVDVDTMIKSLPRNVDDDYCINVHIKRKQIHKSSYLQDIINKRTIKTWLQFLLATPLYTMYEIKMDQSFFDNNSISTEIPLEDISEHIPIEESLTAQQHTLSWDEEQYLCIAPGEQNVPRSLLFDEHAEELSFPSIYLGEFRRFREGIKATLFMMASSELRRSDRRAVTPHHLLYVAMKIMRLRVRDSLTIAFKHVGKNTTVTRQQIEDEHYINNCIETNLAFYDQFRIQHVEKLSPFGKYYVVEYFKRIEFQHRGSPHAHILLWLNNAPIDAMGNDKIDAITLIDNLISVSSEEASGNIKLQTHKHTFTCYKRIGANGPQKCRFEAPFMPSRSTIILSPMQKEEPGFRDYFNQYKSIRVKLENKDYLDMDDFYKDNNILSDDHYHNILRAGINRPRVFFKRQPRQKWNNSFNPFILNKIKSNMDIQFITEEYSCAAYVAEYVNKTNRGVSHLQRLIIEIMNENPEFDIVEVTRKIGVNMLNHVEITSQEAAWYLLREPMSKCSTVVTTIPTMWPVDRQRIRKTQKALDEMGIERIQLIFGVIIGLTSMKSDIKI